MQFTRFKIVGFGKFQDMDVRDMAHPVLVFSGANEAGKSTIFNFLATLLYGIKPVDLTKHQYAPRDGRPLEGWAYLLMDDGTEVRVGRKLAGAAEGRIVAGVGLFERDEALQNRPLPMARHIPERVFRAVYALTLSDMAQVEAQAWQTVQDRLIGRFGIPYVRSAVDVVSELENDANALWRPDKRGKPEIKALRSDRRVLQKELSEARRRQERVRELNEEVKGHADVVATLKAKQVALKEARVRAAAAASRRQTLKKIVELRREAGDLSAFERLPDRPEAALSTLTTQLERHKAAFAENDRVRRELEAILAAYADHDKDVLAHGDEIRSLVVGEQHYRGLQAQMDVDRATRADVQRSTENVAGRTLSVPWSDEQQRELRSVSIDVLRTSYRTFQQHHGALSEAVRRNEERRALAINRKSLMGWIVLAMFSSALAVGLAVLDFGEAAAVAFTAAAVGVVGAMLARRDNARLEQRMQQEPIDNLSMERAAALSSVRSELGGLPIDAHRLEDAETGVIDDLIRLQQDSARRDDIDDRLRRLASQLDEAFAQIGRLAQVARISTDADPMEQITVLGARLKQAEEKRQRATLAEDRMRVVNADRDGLAVRVEALTKEKSALVNALAALGDGDVEAGIRALEARRRAALQAESLAQSLAAGPDENGHDSDPPGAGQEITSDGTSTDPDQVEQALEELEQRLEGEGQAFAAKREQVQHLMSGRDVADVESELAAVETRIEEVKRKRDRLLLLANTIRHADKVMRERYQPDVLATAGSYIEQLTDGRYKRLFMDDSEKALMLYERGASVPYAVGPPMSRGTLDQVYLALRLAIAHHLDAGKERIPLFLDEVLVNWDEQRRKNAYPLLRSVSAERQVLIFTCHDWLAREVCDHIDAAHTDLSKHHVQISVSR